MSVYAFRLWYDNGWSDWESLGEWAMFVFFAVYVGAWAAFGILALTWQWLALRTIGIDARLLLAATLVVAAGWQLRNGRIHGISRVGVMPPGCGPSGR